METKDRYHATYLLFYCLGIIAQVPSSFFITANEYWLYKFRNTSKPFDISDDARTELQAQFTSNFSIVSIVFSIGFIFLTMLSATRISAHVRIVSAFTTQIMLFLVTMVFVVANTDNWQSGFFGFTLFIGSLLNASGSVLNISGILIALKFPPKYLAAQLSGMAVCGAIAALIQIISIANGKHSIRLNALIYFGTGLCMVFATLIFFLVQYKTSDFFNEHLSINLTKTMEKPSKELFKMVFKEVKFFILSMVLLMSSTSLVHPGLTALVKSVNPGTEWGDKFFVPVVTFFLYNVVDFAGRETSPRLNKPTNQYYLLLLSIIRCCFVPLIMFCNAQPRHHTSPAFYSDTAYIIFMLIFAFSHGYLLNLCILIMPQTIPKENMIVAFMLIMIVMMGSQLAFSFINAAMIKAI